MKLFSLLSSILGLNLPDDKAETFKAIMEMDNQLARQIALGKFLHEALTHDEVRANEGAIRSAVDEAGTINVYKMLLDLQEVALRYCTGLARYNRHVNPDWQCACEESSFVIFERVSMDRDAVLLGLDALQDIGGVALREEVRTLLLEEMRIATEAADLAARHGRKMRAATEAHLTARERAATDQPVH